MSGYLLDTNAVSALVKRNSERLACRVISADPSKLAISVVTEAEILFGLLRKPKALRLARDVHSVLQRFERLDWTSSTARAYASLRQQAEARGIGIDALDMLIAAHALDSGHTLVTSDKALHRLKDFLPVEDWV